MSPLGRCFLFLCILSALLLEPAFAQSQNWSLSYSTYLGTPGQLHPTEVPGVLSVNSNGEVCVTSRDSFSPNSNGLLTELASDGSLTYAVATPVAPAGSSVKFVAAIDSAGNCYIAGVGSITPTSGVFQTAPKSGQFVMKFDTAGNVVYATYLGGSGSDTPAELVVDAAGNTYLTGSTNSNDFPTENAYQPAYGGGTSDGFVAVLNPTASALVYSTYLGGSGQDSGAAIAVDGSSNTYITGATMSTNFPTSAPFQSTLAGSENAFVTKLSAAGVPTYSTYLGGSGGSQGYGISADNSGNAYITGSAGAGFPLVNPIQGQGSNGFVSELNPGGSSLVYSTYFGNSGFPGSSIGFAIAVDASGQAYITGGGYWDIEGPVSVPLVSPIASSADDVYVSVLSSGGASVVFSTYLGSADPGCMNQCDYTVSTSIGVDTTGNIYVGGATSSPFPLLNAANGTYVPFTSYDSSLPSYALKIAPASGPVLAFPASVPMPSTPQGTSSQPASLLIANESTAGTLNISSIAATGDFSQTNNCGSALASATNCQLMVTFTPTATGQRLGTVTITDDAPGSPQVINLSGTGLAALVPAVSLTPSSLTFVSQQAGTTSSPQTVTLSNTGLAMLDISNISTSGDFAENNNCGLSLPANNSCQISITFTPTAAGTLTGTLTVTDNATGSPQTVSLSGTGATNGFTIATASGSQGSQTISPGQNATFNLSIAPVSGFSGSVNLSCAITPVVTPAPTCTLPSSVSLTDGNAASAQVVVGTTAATSAMSRTHLPGGSSPIFWASAFFAAGMLLSIRRRRFPIFALLAMLIVLTTILACGGNSSSHTNPGTPAGTYTAAVTGTSGNSSQSFTLTVIVQ